jgi:hypothetical protein
VTTVDLSFPVLGERIPRDHGYALYGALSRAVPSLHGARWLGVHPMGGTLADEGNLQLGQRSQLRLRLPADRIVEVLPLAGAKLDISGSAVRLDVTGFAARYTTEIKRQLGLLEIGGPFELHGRRSLTVGGRRVVGYSVRVLGLSADQSIALQENGIGGKRRMGCGVFRASRSTR